MLVDGIITNNNINIQIRKFCIESQYISRFNGNLIRIDTNFRIICDLTQGICFLCAILISVIKHVSLIASIIAAHIYVIRR